MHVIKIYIKNTNTQTFKSDKCTIDQRNNNGNDLKINKHFSQNRVWSTEHWTSCEAHFNSYPGSSVFENYGQSSKNEAASARWKCERLVNQLALSLKTGTR